MNGTNASAGIPLASLQANEPIVVPFLFVTLSVAVNVVVVTVVSCSRQLHEPRHVYWAGISFSVLLYTGDWLIKAFIDSEADYAACTIYKLTICVSYPSLLSFLFLAGLDRYLAIKHYDWYKRRMTNEKAIASMLAALLLTCLVFDLPYFIGSIDMTDCFYDVTHALCFVGWSAVLGIVNVVMQVRVFVVSRRVIRYYLSKPKGRVKAVHICIDKEAVGARRHVTDRLDFRAALIFSANVGPFLLCTIPLSLNSLAMCVCIRFRLTCSTEVLFLTDAYLKYSVFTPCIVMPLMYMWGSKEFQRAFVHLFWKVERRASSVNRSFHRRTVDRLN